MSAYIQAAKRLCYADSLGSCKEPGWLLDHHFKGILHSVGALESWLWRAQAQAKAMTNADTLVPTLSLESSAGPG